MAPSNKFFTSDPGPYGSPERTGAIMLLEPYSLNRMASGCSDLSLKVQSTSSKGCVVGFFIFLEL